MNVIELRTALKSSKPTDNIFILDSFGEIVEGYKIIVRNETTIVEDKKIEEE